MKVRDAPKINEHMPDAFVRLAPEFERLRKPALRKVMAGRVSVSQAARVAGLPLAEALYVLNLAAGGRGCRVGRVRLGGAPNVEGE